MMILLLALLIGIIAGLRAMMPFAAVSWAAAKGWLPLQGTWAAFMGFRFTPWIVSLLALGELVSDKLPNTPSRKVPPQFAVRVLSGAFAGLLLAMPANKGILGAICGAVGAVLGTLGGAAVRGKLAAAFGKDLPAALLEDAVAIIGAVLIVTHLGY